MTRLCLLGLLLGLSIAMCLLLAQGEESVLKPTTFREGYRSTVPSAGGVVVGVESITNDRFDGRIRVRVPPKFEPQATRVCVNIISLDGRYWAKAEFDVSSGPGPKTLVVPTKYGSVLETLPPVDIAVSAVLADQCEAGSNQYLEASWGSSGTGRPETVILVNAQAGTTVTLVDKLTNAETPCVISAHNGVSYSTSCVFTTSPRTTVANLVLKRGHFESRLKDIPLVIVRQ